MTGYLLLAVRGFVGGVFAVALLSKVSGVQAFRHFAATLPQLTGLAGPPAVLLAGVVVLSEATTVTLLTLPGLSRVGFALAAAQLVAFIGVIFLAVRRGILSECRCFGGNGAVISYPMIGRNVLILLPTLAGLSLTAASVNPVAAIVAGAAGVGVAVAFVRGFDRLASTVMARLTGQRRVPGAGGDHR